MTVKVEFFFDVISPYSYLAWKTLCAYKEQWRLDIVFRPIFLPGLILGSGNTPPAQLPQRASFIDNDIKRTIKWYGLEGICRGVPLNMFSGATKDTVTLQRLLSLAAMHPSVSESVRVALVDLSFRSNWEDGSRRDHLNNLQPMDQKTLRSICIAAGVSDGVTDELLSNMAIEGKRVLKENTDSSISRGLFGVPSFVIYADDVGAPSSTMNFVVFGSDRFEQIAFLLGKRWLGPCPAACKL